MGRQSTESGRTSNRCCHRGRCRRRSRSAGWSLSGLAILLAILVVVGDCGGETVDLSNRGDRLPRSSPRRRWRLLLAENLPGRGLVKEFYLRLTGIVRQYVEDTTGIRAPEQTTEEFLRDMRSSAAFPPERSVRLAEFLEAADLVKYAGQQPGRGPD